MSDGASLNTLADILLLPSFEYHTLPWEEKKMSQRHSQNVKNF